MSARKPKPVPMRSIRGWCRALPDGSVPVGCFGAVAVFLKRRSAAAECVVGGSGKPARVLVIPLSPVSRKATPEELARSHRSAVRVAKRVLRRDGWKVVPDGTPSQDAEVRKLRRALSRAVNRLRGPRMCIDYGWKDVADEIDAALRGRRGR